MRYNIFWIIKTEYGKVELPDDVLTQDQWDRRTPGGGRNPLIIPAVKTVVVKYRIFLIACAGN
ncbi:MAG: hypothetical protein ACYC21_05125 [Eubacteriales bacterium]